MPIDSITMTSFRSHSKTEMVFGPGINVLWGENGSGKTSVLEAIYILSTGRSFKTNRLVEIINEKAEAVRIVGEFKNTNTNKEIVFGQTRDQRRKITINNSPTNARGLLLENRAVLLSPEEQEITKGTPGSRRRFFDRLFSTVSKEYLSTLIDYTKTLKQRNALLKTKDPNKQLDLWDGRLVEKADKIWNQRKVFLDGFSKCLNETSKTYKDEGVTVSLLKKEENPTTETFLFELKKARQKELITQRTSVGPHRDEYSFSFNKKQIKTYGSQGEHKIALVIIKLAEYLFVKKETNQTPTLLLDDLFAKLDFERSDAVLALLEKKTQTIITNTDLVDIQKHGINLSNPKNKEFHLQRPCKN